MKSKFYLMLVAAMTLFASCSSDDTIDVTPEDNGKKVKVTLVVNPENRASFETVDGDSLAGAKWNVGDFLWIYYPQTDGTPAVGKLNITSGAGSSSAMFEGELTDPATGDVQVVCTNNMLADADVTTEGFKIDLKHQSGEVANTITRPEATYYSANDLRFDYGKTTMTVDGETAVVKPCDMTQLFAQLVIKDASGLSCSHRLAIENMPSTGFFSWEKGHITNVGGNNTIIVAAEYNDRFTDETVTEDKDTDSYVTIIPFDVTDTEEHGHDAVSLHIDYSVTDANNNVDYYHFDSAEKGMGKISVTQAGKYYPIPLTADSWTKVESTDQILNNTKIVNVGGVNWATSNMYAVINPGTTINADGTVTNSNGLPYASYGLYQNSHDYKEMSWEGPMGYAAGDTWDAKLITLCNNENHNWHSFVCSVTFDNFYFDQFPYGCSDCVAFDANGVRRDKNDDPNDDFLFSMRFFDLSKFGDGVWGNNAETNSRDYFSSAIVAGKTYDDMDDPELYDVARQLNKIDGIKSEMGIWKTPSASDFEKILGVTVSGGNTVPVGGVSTRLYCKVNGVMGWIYSDYDYVTPKEGATVIEAQSSKGTFAPLTSGADATEVLEDGTIAGNTVFFPLTPWRNGSILNTGLVNYITSTADYNGLLRIVHINSNSSVYPHVSPECSDGDAYNRNYRGNGFILRPVFQYNHSTTALSE